MISVMGGMLKIVRKKHSSMMAGCILVPRSVRWVSGSPVVGVVLSGWALTVFAASLVIAILVRSRKYKRVLVRFVVVRTYRDDQLQR